MRLPSSTRELTSFALNTIEDCRVSQARRMAVYRQYGQWIETGRAAGGLALANMLYGHEDRLASHLFSPTDLRFSIDYENIYDKSWIEKAGTAARLISREWERKNIDTKFGHGVKVGLDMGACLLKHLAGKDADSNFQFRGAELVMPWNFGVYNEGVNDLANQEAMVETVYLNRHEVWRRVRDLPDAEKLFKRITQSANKDSSPGAPNSFMHQVLSTAVLNTSLANATTPMPGGIVQLTNDPNYATLGPDIAPELYPMHELWVRDDDRDGGEDYTMIQLVEPGILVAPLLKRVNPFVKELHPYTLIQANYVPNYFWGRSEICDLMMLQSWLTEHLDDAKRLMGQVIDKFVFIEGMDGLTDELYGQYRGQGFIAGPQGAKVQDLTPSMPEQLVPLISQILMLMDRASGFPPIMSGQGEPGVRAGVHADTLMKTGSPRLRDRSLLLERHCAAAGELTLAMLEAKDAKAYWTAADKEESQFLLSQIPDDRFVSVDSHSSSPIYHEDHAQLIFAGVKAGFITGESAIEELPYNHKDILIRRLKEKEAAQARLIQEHPELLQSHRGHGSSSHLKAV